MDVNDLRVAVTVSGLVLFLLLVLHTYSRHRRTEHEAAAMLPFLEEEPSEQDQGAAARPQGGRRE